MPLTPAQERELQAVAAELAATDPRLARRLTAAGPAGRRPVVVQLVGMVVLHFGLTVGLVPLAVGLGAGLSWLAGIGAVTTCVLPLLILWVLNRSFPCFVARLRALG